MKMKCHCLSLAVMLLAVGNAHAAIIEVTSDRDLGLYTQVAAPVAAPGVMGTQRGAGGRMDAAGISGAGGTSLISFDLSGVVPVGEVIVSAKLELYSARNGSWDANVVAYPMAVSWTEGSGDSGTPGDTGFPWGDAAVGDSVYSFQSTTAVINGEGPSWGPIIVASAGTAWNTPGAQGIGSDLLNRQMFSVAVAGSTSGSGELLGSLDLSTDGVAVLNEWADGSLANNGLNVFFDSGTAPSWQIATREFADTADEFAPRLVIVTAVPEPSTTLLLALAGVLGLGRRMRNH